MMKKLILIGIAVFGMMAGLNAHPVDQATASAIAVKFMGTNDVQLVAAYQTDQETPALYVYNTPNGFVIVSADDCETPIIGYSHEGRFNPDDLPIQLQDYLQDFVDRIQYGAAHHLEADETTARQWELVKATGRLNDNPKAHSVSPLVTAHWHQGCLYNSLCPVMENLPCERAQVGCVAVAMGQIMHYWNYPSIGWGSYSYNIGNFSISANFGNTTYQWGLMPNTLTEASSDAQVEAVATLLYHCGVAVEMKYGDNGSFTNSGLVRDALINYFKYSHDIHREIKDEDNAVWLSKLKTCLDAQKPILYSGAGNAGHAFVCDGYDANDLLHFNWGWGGSHDGYFALGNLNPNGNNFNSGNYAIFDIAPNTNLYVVTASVFPEGGGHIEGLGGYYIHETCTLTAEPEGDCEFCYWLRTSDNSITSFSPSIDIHITENLVNNSKAFFCLRPATGITAGFTPEQHRPVVNLSWEQGSGNNWPLLAQFPTGNKSVISDGQYIYLTNTSNSGTPSFSKYTLDGEFIENFIIEGLEESLVSFTFDGTYFYGANGLNLFIFVLDFEHKQLVDQIRVQGQVRALAYDPLNDGLWVRFASNRLFLIDRTGHTIDYGDNYLPSSVHNLGFIMGNDQMPHLLAVDTKGDVFEHNNVYRAQDGLPFTKVPKSNTVFFGDYKGHNALFLCNEGNLYIYEAADVFSRVCGYRIYRSDAEGNTTLLAEAHREASFTDSGWDLLENGTYRYGVSSLLYRANTETDILWSDYIVKNDHGVNEAEDDTDPKVQKIYENGRIVIIKNGKRYNILGQEIE